MSYCSYCEFTAPNHSRYLKHLGTKKHAIKYLEATKHLDNPNQNIVFSQSIKKELQETQNANLEKKENKPKPKRKYIKKSKTPQLETLNQETVQETKLSEDNVQESDTLETPFFLDTGMLDLYHFLSNPINPIFLLFIKIIITLKTFFGLNDKVSKNDLSGNE